MNEGLEANSLETIVALVRQGFGVAIVPKLENVQWQRDNRLKIIDIPGSVIDCKVGLLEHSSHSHTEFTAAIALGHTSGRSSETALADLPDYAKIPTP